MILGALIDAGIPLDDVRKALGSLAVDPSTVWTERVTRTGISATKFCVRGEGAPQDHADDHDGHHHHHHEHGHAHAHAHDDAQHHPHTHPHETRHQDHHAHRSLDEISRLIDRSGLSATGKTRSIALFRRLAEVEAGIHGMSVDDVHLHEVGALDSIVDIVGTVYALESLGVDRIVSSPLNVGSGSIRSAHGLYPVPAPATTKLLEGAPIYAGPQRAELVTPTGALLVTGYASEFGVVPPMRLQAIGYGAGTRDFPDTPNVLRVLIGEADSAAASQSVVAIEADIDDMNPQIFGVLMDRLLADGALDVFYTPIQMKKNRPGTLLTVIAMPDARPRLTSTIFRETTTIGVRYREMTREVLERETVTVQTALGAIRVKVARRHGEILNASPEFEDCVRVANDSGRPLKDVQLAAMQAFAERKITPGA